MYLGSALLYPPQILQARFAIANRWDAMIPLLPVARFHGGIEKQK